jgi:catechol 2,3-dioxygenase-like lactoylglutathione lyase family enzyme
MATAWPGPVRAITLVTDDLAAARQFYGDVFGLPVHFEDDSSAVFRFGDTLVNLLDVVAAPELVEPARVGPSDATRSVLTLDVDDVDARCAELRGRGVDLLNGPVDRPWGPRTASFRDPAGQVWELSGPPAG